MSELTREKVEAGHYRLVTETGELDVVKLAERDWVVQIDLEDADETVDLGRYETLSAAEKAAMDSTVVNHWLDRARAVLEGRPIDWSVDPDEGEEVEVAWQKPSGHGASSLHRTANGETTLCGNPVRGDRPRLEESEADGRCGHCFK